VTTHFSTQLRALRGTGYHFFLGLSGLLMLAAFLVGSARAASIKMVATGDSMTLGYNIYYPMTNPQTYFADTGKDVTIQTMAYGGMKTHQYDGSGTFSYPPPDGPLVNHDFAQDVADAKPDYIVFMLGTNDVVGDRTGDVYKSHIPVIFDHWKNGPKVFVCSVLPVPEIFADINRALDEVYNPFLKEQAEQYGFSFLDVNAMFRALPDNQSLFQGPANVHLNDVGSTWLADTVCGAVKADILAVPEPTMMLMMWALPAFLLPGFGFMRWRRKGRA
jgi:hypothetical protein